ncbi:MAG TPA: FecR family protein [Stellaceae bacterium]|nr:FecR family protein [Stellaceae bacterium]
MRLGLAVALAASWLAAGTAWAAEDAGTVLTLKGDCFVEAGGQKSTLKPGDAVHVGDKVEVPDGAKLKLRMADGSVISAASGTTVTIAAYSSDGSGRDAELSLAAGLLRAVVTPASGSSRFEVDTATGVAAVRSTDWFVEAGAGAMRVGVLSGVVNMESRATKHGVDIPAGRGSKLEAGKDPEPARVWAKPEFDKVIAATNLD